MPRQLFFLPGNPGNCAFYEQLLSRLVSRFHVVAIDYPGHAPGSGKGGTLQELVEAVHARIRRALTPGAVLVGHSLGAYVAGQVLSRPLPCKFAKTILLHPAVVSVASTPAGQAVRAKLYRGLAPVTRVLPDRVLCKLARRSTLPRRALSTKFVRQHLRTWEDEKRTIKTPDNWLTHKNLVVFVNERDGWTPPDAVAALKQKVRDLRTFDIPHDFGDNDRHCAKVSSLINSVLKKST